MIEIKSATSYTKEQLLQPVLELVKNGFQAKFTNRLFHDDEVDVVLYTLANYLCEMKKESLIIAEYHGEIAACLFLTSYKEKYPHLKDVCKDKLSFKQYTKLSLLLILLSHQAKENEKYIDFVSVLPEYRSHGIGSMLINYIKNEFQDYRITLYVAGDNFRAYDLYRKLNFKLVCGHSSSFLQKITGIKHWFLMDWDKTCHRFYTN